MAAFDLRNHLGGVAAPGVGFLNGGRPCTDGMDRLLAPHIRIGGIEGNGLIGRQDKLFPGLLADIVTMSAVLGKDRLDLFEIIEKSRLPVPAIHRAGQTGYGLGHRAHRRCGILYTVFVAADASLNLPGLDDRAAAHRLNHHPFLIQKLEIDEPVGRYLKIGRAIFLHRHGPQNAFILKGVPAHGGRLLTLAEPAITPAGIGALLGRFHHAQRLHRAALHSLHVRADIDILHVEFAGFFLKIPSRRTNQRHLTRHRRHRVKASGRILMHYDLVAKGIQKDDSHLLLITGRAACQEKMPVQRIRVLVLHPQGDGAVKILPGIRIDPFNKISRPGLEDRFPAIDSELAVDNRQRSPGSVVAGGKGRQHQVAPRDGPSIEHGPGRRGIIAPVNGVLGSIGVANPEPLRVAKIPVHILPARVEDAPIGQQRGMPLKERTPPDLVDIGPILIHPEEIAHDMSVAHTVLGLAGGGENDAPVIQINRVDIRDSRR